MLDFKLKLFCQKGKISGKGKSVTFYPSGAKGRFFNIQIHSRNVKHAICGDNIGLEIKDLTSNNMPRIGDIMCIDNDISNYNNNYSTYKNNINYNQLQKLTFKQCKRFTARVLVTNYPGRLKCAVRILKDKKRNYKNNNNCKNENSDGSNEYETYKNGYTTLVYIHQARVPCQMIYIIWKKGKSTNMLKHQDASYVQSGDEAEIIFEPTNPLVVFPFDQCKRLGRFVAMDSNSMVMMGKVLTVDHQD